MSLTTTPAGPPRAARRSPSVPRPRRFPIVLGCVASIGVAATSLRAVAAPVLVLGLVAWLGAFAVAAGWRRGDIVLTVLASAVKVMTLVLLWRAIVDPGGHVGPVLWWYWIPLGALNAATGIWLLRVIRHRDA